MSYEIKKQITIHNTNEDWEYVFTNDEYGSVTVRYTLESTMGTSIAIPKDCIQNFINALEQFK
jgi:hypothetical protein